MRPLPLPPLQAGRRCAAIRLETTGRAKSPRVPSRPRTQPASAQAAGFFFATKRDSWKPAGESGRPTSYSDEARPELPHRRPDGAPSGGFLRAIDRLAPRRRRVNRSKQFARRPFRVRPIVRLTPPTLAQLKRQRKPSLGRKPVRFHCAVIGVTRATLARGLCLSWSSSRYLSGSASRPVSPCETSPVQFSPGLFSV
jgi:hypothetical protein